MSPMYSARELIPFFKRSPPTPPADEPSCEEERKGVRYLAIPLTPRRRLSARKRGEAALELKRTPWWEGSL